MPITRIRILVAAFLVAACGGSSELTSPRATARGMHVIKGADVTDTANAVLIQALIVEVRDSTGRLAPVGTSVRFSGVPRPQSLVTETLVEALSSNVFASFATGVTDADGHAAVIVRLGSAAGPARLAISVPLFGFADTARFTILPGAATRVSITPTDTLVYVGASYTYRGGVLDAYGNTRSDPVSFAASGSGVAISGSALSASAVGRYTITATAGTGSGTATVSVAPRGRIAGQRPAGGANITIADMDGSNSRILTSPVLDGGVGIRPVWMPGGRSIVFANLIAGVETLQTVDTNGVSQNVFPQGIPNVTHQADAAPTYDGQWLYFAAYDSRCSSDGYCLYRSRIDGSAPQLIGSSATMGNNLRPSPSPDGSRVAVVTGSFFNPTIKVIDVATKTAAPWAIAGNDPAWSPDGSQIAYLVFGTGNIALINPDGTGQRTLTPPDRLYADAQMGWTADGKYLIARRTSGILELVDPRDGSNVPLPWTTNFAGSSIK